MLLFAVIGKKEERKIRNLILDILIRIEYVTARQSYPISDWSYATRVWSAGRDVGWISTTRKKHVQERRN